MQTVAQPVTDTRHLVDLPPGRSPREADRQAMRAVLADRGFEHALPSIAQAVAVETTDTVSKGVDERLEQAADQIEAAVLDALVHYARGRGWRGAR